MDKKTTKCRVDASAYDEHEVTLNDCILSGPALQPNLVSVVEKMFLQSSRASAKISLVGGFPLDSLAKSGFP